MKKISLLIPMLTISMLMSCDVIKQTSTSLLSSTKPLTTTEITTGLKMALMVGTDSASTRLSRIDGYYLDPVVKVNLPPDAEYILSYLRKVPGLDQQIDEVILRINRSAEDAALKATPIFKNAIQTMSIIDAWSLLNGSDSSATAYLHTKTYNSLYEIYLPIMKESLNKPIIANISAQNSLNEMTTIWNRFATSFAGKLLELKTIDPQIESFVTQKALDGLFIKIAAHEKEIRHNADARVNDILKRVFEKQE